MEPLPVDVLQLQRRDPAAWSALLIRAAGGDVEFAPVVTAVTSEPLEGLNFSAPSLVSESAALVAASRRARRYVLRLDGVSDPVSYIGKRTTAAEAIVYRAVGPRVPGILPHCHYAHVDGDRSWVILDEVPDDFPPARWTGLDLDGAASSLGALHAATWEDAADLETLGRLPHYRRLEGEAPQRFDEARGLLIDEGPGAIISEHAISVAGRLAPRFLAAANGLLVMRDLGGWPGVLGESQLGAAADLIDDPLPLLDALADLPDSLLHTGAHPYHWRVTLFGEQYLIDWSMAQRGPGVLDLVGLLEHYPLVFSGEGQPIGLWAARDLSPAEEEMAVDSYLLSLSSELGPRFPARAVRQSLPAARCLHTLLTWFPYFASWSGEMPNKYVWQRVNRMSDSELVSHGMGELIGLRPYLAGVFARFLQAYREL